jgi:hypothetical protein
MRRLALLTILVLASGPALVDPTPAESAQTCFGRKATIADRHGKIIGTPGDDAIVGDDGDYRMLNEMMLRDGFAGSATDHSYTKHDDTLSDAANAARDEAAGLWGECGGLHAEITPTPVVPTPTPTFEEIVTQYPPIPDIRELAIRPGSLFGERISFSGTILTIQVAIPGNVFILGDSNPAGYGTAIQVTVPAPDGSTEVIFVGYDGDTTGMFEGTWVTIFGTVVDTQSGENLLGGSITQPLVAAELVLIG